jgi:hypothetical protein
MGTGVEGLAESLPKRFGSRRNTVGTLAIISEATVRRCVTRQLAFDAVRGAFEISSGVGERLRFTSAEEAVRGSDIVVTVTRVVFEVAQETGQVEYIEF